MTTESRARPDPGCTSRPVTVEPFAAASATPLVHAAILAQAERTPAAPAVRQWNQQLSYRQVSDAAAGLAVRLRALGAGPEQRVGICMRRTPSLIPAVLGVLMAGAAYVPLDLRQPARRLAGVLDDAGIDVVVVDEAGAALLAGSGRELLDAGGPPADAVPAPTVCLQPGNAAYVIYTSGSTGRPKGVVVSHRSVTAFADAVAGLFPLGAGCRSIGFAALAFDVSVLDIWVPLTRGGAVQLIPDEDRMDPARLQRFLEAHEVTWGTIPPALLPLLDPDRLPGLTDLLTAGEPPGPEQVARWSRRRRFHNWYGPTETTVCVVGTELTGKWDRPVPIGTQLPGSRAYVMDDKLEVCPPGVPGELVIGGVQLARGYLGRPGLTAERFVADPFGTEPGGRLYRTGDRAVVEADGRISFLGRLDRQLKVQGQRVETGEVESVLRAHPRVGHAVVDGLRGGAGMTELVAYVAPLDAPEPGELREHCATLLPDYMIPGRFLRLAELPLNVSGKVDLAELRGRLQDRPSDHVRRAPRGPFERMVATAWARLFEISEPGLDDGFLACGGHSLLAMRLVSALRAESGRDIAAEDVFAGRTVEGLAARLERAVSIGSGDAVPTAGEPVLSAAQRRMWFVEQLTPGTPAHNIQIAERLRGPLDVAALGRALGAVAARHEVLRWRIPQRAGIPYVAVDPPGEVVVPVEESGPPVASWLTEQALVPFDLTAGPLWRVRLMRLAPDDHVLAITVHHIVFDGWSQDVLYRDLAECYAAARAGRAPGLAPLPATFSDYAAWSRTWEGSAERLGWWTRHLSGVRTVLELPADRARPPVRTFRGANRQVTIDPAVAGRIADLAGRLGTTPYPVLLAAFAVLVRRLTGHHDFVLGTPLADRRHAAFEAVVGCFLQVLPLRMRIGDDESFADHVLRCARELGEAMRHADTPLERLVEGLGVPRDLTRNPLIQVLFNMYNFAEPRLALTGVAAEPLPAGLPGSLFDLTMYVTGRDNGIDVNVVYNPDLYDDDRAAALLASYVHLLDDLVRRPEEPIRAASPPDDHRLPQPDAELPCWTGRGVVEQVTAVANRRPGEVAVCGSGGQLSYRELDGRWRAAMSALRAAGLAPGDVVGVLAARDTALVPLLLGVLAAGARWAVLDPELPAALLDRQAAAARASALAVCPGLAVPEPLRHLPVVSWHDGTAESVDPVDAGCRGYVSFTSGTTGEPKPVVTTEQPLAHFLDWYTAAFDLTGGERVAMLSGLAHDPLLRDVFTPLVLGARLCVPEPGLPRDPDRLAGWLRTEQISVVHLTPQLARSLTRQDRDPLPALRLVALGGDRLTASDVARLRRLAPAARLINLYGTTETPQAQAFHDVTDTADGAGALPVGRGIDGAQLLVLDDTGRQTGIGELGEIVIRSRHLAEGYLDAELSRRRFVQLAPGDRAYRTGDRGRYLPDGTVSLDGRADDQVKVRGFRVELGEVAAALEARPEVAAAVAVPVDAGGERSVRACVVPSHPAVRGVDLLQAMRSALPGHAVPAEVVILGELPLTPAGKVDRAALSQRGAAPPRPATPNESVSSTERLVAGVWRQVLGSARFGAEENFFDIGGHSLALVEVQARLADLLSRRLSMLELFRHPTVRALAAHLDGDGRAPGLDWAQRRIVSRRQRGRRGSAARDRGATD